MNTQPWHLHVLTGEPLEKVRMGNSERMLAGEPVVREIGDYSAYDGVHRDRQIEIAVQLFEAMGIERQGIMQSPVVREHAQIPDDQVILTCVALGWPDKSFVANDVVSRRRPVANATRFVGFDKA